MDTRNQTNTIITTTASLTVAYITPVPYSWLVGQSVIE